MKLFREVIIIFGVYYLGELCANFLPLPGNLIGMLILLLLLCTRIVKLDQISTFSDFLLGHLPFFFIPAGVALLSVMGIVKDVWIAILVICLVTTFLTMGISGKCVQLFMKKKED